MKIKGYIRDGTPLIDAALIIGHLNIDRPITFLVDTGASNTAILDIDSEPMHIDFDKLTKVDEPMCGIGGPCETFQTEDTALILKCDDGSLHVERLSKIYFLRHQTQIEDERLTAMLLPSVLGRDVLSRYVLTLNDKKSIILSK